MYLFSHGFGVKQDSRGMFSQIADLLGAKNCRLFDYNKIDPVTGEVTVIGLDDQAEILRNQIGLLGAEPIDLICHSQGCLVAALVKPKVRSVVLLAPASTVDSRKFASYFAKRQGSELDFDGQSRLSRSDGSSTFISKEYWPSLDAIKDADAAYSELAKINDLHVVLAGADNVLGKTNFPNLKALAKSYQTVEGADHDFTGSSRKQLLNQINQLYNS